MAISEFTIKQNDTAELLNAILNDSVSTSFSLAGAIVVFSMRSTKDRTVKISRASVTITDATTRQVTYSWSASNTDTVGDYEAEFEVTLSTGKIITFPNSNANMLIIHIVDDIG